MNDSDLLRLLEMIVSSFATVPGKGIPLGNLTSQLFANIYLHELDWFVKHTLRERWYLRYCDDFIIVHPSREHLQTLLSPLDEFLEESLRVHLHPRKIVLRTWTQGIDFLGYVLFPFCTVLRTKTKRRMIERVSQANLSSYLGICSHASAHRLRQLVLSKVWQR